ncbi:hypothetical protein KC850_00355 [Candidatus Kaiserbacteria bacterium]|nr:hypothetical protein [Candidatus Kaiserbacteria bacterium]
MKKKYRENKFLEQLERVPNVSLACEKVGLARNTIYRWRGEDSAFAARMDTALMAGTESVNDLAESKLISHINNGSMRAIQYWLDNHKKEYIKPRPKMEQQPLSPVTKIVIQKPDGIEVGLEESESKE